MVRTSEVAGGHRRHIAAAYRSGLEEQEATRLQSLGVRFEYEKRVLTYTRPAKTHRYTPDFFIPHMTDEGHPGVYVETKGYFDTEDRQKHLLVREAHPSLDIRLVFSNPGTRISKQSATTYAAWADSKGFLWAKKNIPLAWLAELGYPIPA